MTRDVASWAQREAKVHANNYNPLPVLLTQGKGVWLWDASGKRYLDMMSAYSAVSHGHAHPELVAAMSQQAQTLSVVSRAFHHDQLLPLAEHLCDFAQMDRVLFMNTGVEAVETALKAARRWGYRHKKIPENAAEIIVAQDNFHGRTLGVISASTEPEYRKDFGPFLPGFRSVPFGDAAALEAAITPNTCAVLIEPMQGEAGIKIPPQGYLKAVAQACQKHKVLLLLDEIQTGLGRTGAKFAFMHEGITPDGIMVGKALGGGLLPVSAFLARNEVMDVFDPGSHGSTFGGNPLACRVAKVALEILERDHLVEASAHLGAYLMEQLKDRLSGHPFVKEVRGCGLWVGLEVATEHIHPRQICEKLMQHGLLTKDAHDSVIRLAPPLVVTAADLDGALHIVHRVFEELKPA